MRNIEPIYNGDENGKVLLYSGDLILTFDDVAHNIKGDIELLFETRSKLQIRVAGSERWLMSALFNETVPSVAIPANADLSPPSASAVAQRSSDEAWTEYDHWLNTVTAGNVNQARLVVFHVRDEITDRPLPRVEASDGDHRQIRFRLPGWELALANTNNQRASDNEFAHVIAARPLQLPITIEQVDRLRRQLFILLSFIRNRETGVGTIVGLNEKDDVVWVQWDAPRSRPGRNIRWCDRSLAAQALPVIADGLGTLSGQPMETVIDRAVNHLATACGNEVLDVRIPIACFGLELLGWAVLQERQWLTPDVLNNIPAASRLRLLLQWAGIPIELPSEFNALLLRRGSIGKPEFAGPEIVFNIRNALVHPPKRLNQLEWPKNQELVECWQLATWYLELVILRILGYGGRYAKRLKLNVWEGDTELVPWADSDPN